jgi:hypothetical protein
MRITPLIIENILLDCRIHDQDRSGLETELRQQRNSTSEAQRLLDKGAIFLKALSEAADGDAQSIVMPAAG